jgi:hypothetical protein
VAEASMTGETLFGFALPRLKILKTRHEELLDAAWLTWENETYYKYPLDRSALSGKIIALVVA